MKCEPFLKDELEIIRQNLDSIMKKQDELYLLVKKVPLNFRK